MNSPFKISPFFQELIVYCGQLLCYEKCPELIEKFIGVEIGHSQINRITDLYGKALEEIVCSETTLGPIKSEDILYAEVDGSMIFTRDKDWKEVKVARIFKGSDCIDPNGKSSWIRHSQYLARLENSNLFSSKVENIFDLYEPKKGQLVFLTDGAVWIRNWIEDAYPNAVSILDIFHALEYLNTFAESIFKDKKVRRIWVDKQKDLLLESKVLEVIEQIKAKANNAASEKIIAYYQANLNRMNYKEYQKIGIGIIGSGAIESAHRTVIQKRMKQSGQRWSFGGAQNMLNLRVTYMNEKWSNVISIIKEKTMNSNFKKCA